MALVDSSNCANVWQNRKVLSLDLNTVNEPVTHGQHGGKYADVTIAYRLYLRLGVHTASVTIIKFCHNFCDELKIPTSKVKFNSSFTEDNKI